MPSEQEQPTASAREFVATRVAAMASASDPVTMVREIMTATSPAELARIRNQRKRFPVRMTITGYAVQSAGMALMLQPTSSPNRRALHD